MCPERPCKAIFGLALFLFSGLPLPFSASNGCTTSYALLFSASRLIVFFFFPFSFFFFRPRSLPCWVGYAAKSSFFSVPFMKPLFS